MTVIYVDTLFLLNALVDYLLLLASARLAGEPPVPAAVPAGGGAGGAVRGGDLPAGAGVSGPAPLPLAAAAVMVLAAFWNSRRLLRQTVIFFALSCALGGGVLAVGLLGGRGLSLRGGVLYSGMDLKILLLSAAGCYALLTLALRGAARHTGRAGSC